MKFPRWNGGNVADFQATKGVRCAWRNPRGSAHTKSLSNYVIARHAFVPWQSPERVPFVCNYLLLWLNYRLRIYSRFQRHCLCNTPTAPLPRPPPRARTKKYAQRNCLAANEIVLRKMKSRCVGLRTKERNKSTYTTPFSNRNYVKLRTFQKRNHANLSTFSNKNYVKLRSLSAKNYAKLRTFYFSNYVKLRSFVDKSENNVYNWT